MSELRKLILRSHSMKGHGTADRSAVAVAINIADIRIF
jgi:hypothetical protein